MIKQTASAEATPNIALIKYWGNRDQALRLPVNGSISMNLEGLITRTSVTFDPDLLTDVFSLNNQTQSGSSLSRVTRFLDLIRDMSGRSEYSSVVSHCNFPIGAGIASSAAAFAALAIAGARAAGLELDEAGLSRLARRGSGSASRSIPGGFVEWEVGTCEEDSFASSIAPADYWDLVDCIAVVATEHKPVGSTEGHALAGTSILQQARVEDTPRRLEICRRAILERDFTSLAEIVEQDSTLMHAVMMTSTPPLFYWEPASMGIMKVVPAWRAEGLPCCFTLDAGPNVHVLCPAEFASDLAGRLSHLPGVQRVFSAHVGGPAHLV
jgi:diphosphomevalonate decarboxylase